MGRPPRPRQCSDYKPGLSEIADGRRLQTNNLTMYDRSLRHVRDAPISAESHGVVGGPTHQAPLLGSLPSPSPQSTETCFFSPSPWFANEIFDGFLLPSRGESSRGGEAGASVATSAATRNEPRDRGRTPPPPPCPPPPPTPLPPATDSRCLRAACRPSSGLVDCFVRLIVAIRSASALGRLSNRCVLNGKSEVCCARGYVCDRWRIEGKQEAGRRLTIWSIYAGARWF